MVETGTKPQSVWLIEKVPIHNTTIYPHLFLPLHKRLVVDDGPKILQTGGNIIRVVTFDNVARHQIDHVVIIRDWKEHWCDAHFSCFAKNESWRSSIIRDCHDDLAGGRSVGNLGILKFDIADQKLGQLNADGGLSREFCGVSSNLGRLQSPKNQIAIHASDYDQQSGKYNQEKIEPPAGIIWCRRAA